MAKVMVSLPDELLRQVDDEVKRRSTSRSALLAVAVRRELSRSDPAAVDAAIDRSRERFRRTREVLDAESLVRADRDGRR